MKSKEGKEENKSLREKMSKKAPSKKGEITL